MCRGSRIWLLPLQLGLTTAPLLRSGCSTFLKTLANETHGFFVSEESHINYQGITPKQMRTNFAGEAI